MSKKIKVDQKLISNLSKLAKLNFDQEAAEKMKSDLNVMLHFVDVISKIDTTDVKPLIYLSKETNVLRNDEVKNSISQNNALKNAPQKDSDYFKVPTVLKK
tara:strand:- start:252 stop:554 length:303 start_codon:yes stop_codon:yes gene_type:complete